VIKDTSIADVNVAIAEALGIDPNLVGSIRIDIRPEAMPQITVVKYLTAEDVHHVRRIVEKYELVRKEEA